MQQHQIPSTFNFAFAGNNQEYKQPSKNSVTTWKARREIEDRQAAKELTEWDALDLTDLTEETNQ